ncbi:Ca2+-dependent phosphoinositide-specific phospholipase C [Polyangium sp. 15x6]|uniref:Ca2+-dependent phosphoinositide-specific phospholipase C n=1 Tax=Polyangium sp. 15x6 TaxID=3042687 RepID=UPI00249BE3DE|nr:Ca2+-dependent phosphoinositide-specific phospholipase C [Polyangium sp. 15x6]MDI3283621.1 Ca2+-dependent phosphoinositide-specific phospholipase C [Polyangium sp. 15x6]
MSLRSRVAACLGLVVALAGCGGGEGDSPEVKPPDPPPKFAYPLDDVLRLNHLQTKSTHNSYHIETEENTVGEWRYTHAPLDVQLGAQGVRHVELDLRYNLDLESFEVYHLPLLDEQTTCRKLTDCLRVLKNWSDAHRAHHPIVVQFEIKDAVPDDEAGAEGYFAALHEEIRSVWPDDRILVPDEVQGDAPTLREAVLSKGWPTLGEVRGHVLFTLDDSGDARKAYTKNHTSLAGRIVFADASPADPWAAIAIINDPLGEAAAIAEALAANMVVRTRADGNAGEVIETGSTIEREAAIASGAQFVSTDFPAKVPEAEYWVEIPDGTPSRCNPITAPSECSAEAIEDPKFVGP